MGFVDPKGSHEDDQELPGAAGLFLDLDLKRCPVCRREVTPWQDECPDCGEVAVAASAVPAAGFALPGLLPEDVTEDADDGASHDRDRPTDDRGDAA